MQPWILNPKVLNLSYWSMCQAKFGPYIKDGVNDIKKALVEFKTYPACVHSTNHLVLSTCSHTQWVHISHDSHYRVSASDV